MDSAERNLKEEDKAFYAEGLAKLRAGDMQESTGKLIMDLMEVQEMWDIPRDKILVTYARKWIKLFPKQDSAPRMVGKWLESYGSNDAQYLATSYVKTFPNVDALIFIVKAVSKMDKIPSKLSDAIDRRFASDPNSHVWSRLFNPDLLSEEIDEKIVRWLQINHTRSDFDFDVALLALGATTPILVDEIFRWTEANLNKGGRIYLVVSNLLIGFASHDDVAVKARAAALARKWLEKNSNQIGVGSVLGALLDAHISIDDLKYGKEWYSTHKDDEVAGHILESIISCAHNLKEEQDLELIQDAKGTIESSRHICEYVSLVFALLKVSPTAESIEWAKQCLREDYLSPRAEGYIVFLRLAPDSFVIECANKYLTERPPIEPDLFLELLKLDSSNLVALKAAKKWLRTYGDDPECDRIKEVESALSKSTSAV